MKALNFARPRGMSPSPCGGLVLVLPCWFSWSCSADGGRRDLKQSVEAAQTELVTRQQALARPSADVKVRAERPVPAHEGVARRRRHGRGDSRRQPRREGTSSDFTSIAPPRRSRDRLQRSP